MDHDFSFAFCKAYHKRRKNNRRELMMKNQNIIIASSGKVTYVMVNGKVYGDHVVKVEFIHDHKDKPNDARLLVTTDCVPLEGDASDEERLAFMKRVELLSELQGGE
jgi:hypothetical protein